MTEHGETNIVIEKVGLERITDVYDAGIESREELFPAGFIPRPHFSIEELNGWINAVMEDWENDNRYAFFVMDKSTQQVVGWVSLGNVNRVHQFASMDYWVRTSRIGQGIATEAVKLIAQYGFQKLGFQRLEIIIAQDNLPSLRVAEKAGALREGLLRNRLKVHDVLRDAYVYSLIPADFANNKSA